MNPGVKILLQWCLHRSVQILHQSRHLIPLHGSGVYTSSYEIWNCTGQKVDLLFPGPKHLLTLSYPFKNRPVPPVQCKRKVEPCKFLSVQKFVRTLVNGVSVPEVVARWGE